MDEGEILAQMELRGVDVQILDYHWPHNHQGWDIQDRHVLSLSLSPVPAASQGRFAGVDYAPCPVGAILFMPSRMALESHCSGGFQRIVRCRFSPTRFTALTCRNAGWSEQELAISQDLHSPALRSGLRRLAQEIHTPAFGAMTAASALADMLAVDLIRCLTRAAEVDGHSHGGLPPHTLRRIEQRITTREQAIPTVSALATITGLSSRHLLRAFQESTGMTVRQRLQQEYKARAEAMLADTIMPIGEIAERLGFRSVSSFSTMFRRLSGESPRDYRLRMR